MNHVSVCPTDGNGPTQGQRKTLTRVGFGSCDDSIRCEESAKWSEFKSHDTPSALRGSLELNSSNGDEALLAESIASITSSELLIHLIKLNAAFIIISDISC